MNAPIYSNQLLRTAPPLALSTPGSYSLHQGTGAALKLRLLPDPVVMPMESLRQYSARVGREIAAAEGIAFAALTASGMAAVIAGFYF